MKRRVWTLRVERLLEIDEVVSRDRIHLRMRVDPTAPGLPDRIEIDLRLAHPARLRTGGGIAKRAAWDLLSTMERRHPNPFRAARDWLHDQFACWDAGPPWLEVAERIETLARLAVARCDRAARRSALRAPGPDRFVVYKRILAERARRRRASARR